MYMYMTIVPNEHSQDIHVYTMYMYMYLFDLNLPAVTNTENKDSTMMSLITLISESLASGRLSAGEDTHV